MDRLIYLIFDIFRQTRGLLTVLQLPSEPRGSQRHLSVSGGRGQRGNLPRH